MTLENVQALYQTIANIFAEKYNISVRVIVKKGGLNGRNNEEKK